MGLDDDEPGVAGIPNLDALNRDQLLAIHETLSSHGSETVKRWIGKANVNDREIEKVAATLKKITWLMAGHRGAFEERLAGNVARAKVIEAEEDRLWDQLPDWARW